MANEINGVPNNAIRNPINTNKADSQDKVDANKTGESQTNNAPATDSVKLTENAKQIAALEKRIDDIPEVDQERVEALKKAINSGEYQVDAESIAKKLTQLESLLP